MQHAGDFTGSIDFPNPVECEGGDVTTIDAFLGFQRNAVQVARQIVDQYANVHWRNIDAAHQQLFTDATIVLPPLYLPINAWRRAWWLHTIGGQPRAPFETTTSPTVADQLVAALRAAMAPIELPEKPRQAFAEWWYAFIEHCRMRIAGHVEARIAQSRSAIDSIAEEKQAAKPRRKASGVTRERLADAERRAMEAHRALDKRFEILGSVCRTCTRETGGCCTLTVPLIWREADYRLLALDDGAVPLPAGETAGACPFLGTMGCRLPANRRPFICRSFLCDRAEAALGDNLPLVRRELLQLANARSQLGG